MENNSGTVYVSNLLFGFRAAPAWFPGHIAAYQQRWELPMPRGPKGLVHTQWTCLSHHRPARAVTTTSLYLLLERNTKLFVLYEI